MFIHVFILAVRHYLVPAAAIWVLQTTFMGYQGAFLGVNVVLTIVTIPFTLWHIIKILPNLALIRTEAIAKLVVQILMELFSLIVFWGVYLAIFG